jgi:hypothetical protein
MSNDEIVKVLKSRGALAALEASQDPAGSVEISEEDLDAVAGGTDTGGDPDAPTMKECTTEATVCKGTCCIPWIGGCCGDEGGGEYAI